MVPLIEREVIESRGWVAREDFLDLLTLAQSAPGPIALNTAVFVGYRICGLRGALTALAGIVFPAFSKSAQRYTNFLNLQAFGCDFYAIYS